MLLLDAPRIPESREVSLASHKYGEMVDFLSPVARCDIYQALSSTGAAVGTHRWLSLCRNPQGALGTASPAGRAAPPLSLPEL